MLLGTREEEGGGGRRQEGGYLRQAAAAAGAEVLGEPPRARALRRAVARQPLEAP
eukprot:SAG11_NODE_11604_length_749_cov_3.095385_2_plen_54_part_01